jgi:hypothetical protein
VWVWVFVGFFGGGGGLGGEMTQALYAHMNNKRKKQIQQHTTKIIQHNQDGFFPGMQR